MGIDIYLNGYDAYEERTKKERAAFNRAVKARDKVTLGRFDSKSLQHAALQAKVEAAADKMWAGCKGYLQSSYNGGGLFRVLEEIFGFDVAEYLFPGDWKDDVRINGQEFTIKVKNLQRTAELALGRHNFNLPWINEFTELTGTVAPDPNPVRAKAELFGDSVFAMFTQAAPDAIMVEGGPTDERPRLSQDHQWYLTKGLSDLLDFGKLATELNGRGEETVAHISY